MKNAKAEFDVCAIISLNVPKVLKNLKRRKQLPKKSNKESSENKAISDSWRKNKTFNARTKIRHLGQFQRCFLIQILMMKIWTIR